MNPIKVLPVYSKLAQSVPIENIPTECSLREHQVKTFNAIRDPDIDVIFNAAMTGDGKSLAAYLPALVDNQPILAMYPTNELIRDQLKQIVSYCNRFSCKIEPEYMFSEKLYELRAQLEMNRQAQVISFLARKHEILLTNPDIFNLIANFEYMREYENPDILLQTVIGAYNIFLFDEFHLYDVSQVVSVLTTMQYIIQQTRDTRDRKKFVFLSATPNPLLLECLKKSKLQYEVIKGNYLFENVDQQSWNQISQPFTLHFHEVDRQTGATEAWVQSHFWEIADWFSDGSGSRAAIIVNSVATAKRIVGFFEERQAAGDFPYSIGEITGVTGKPQREVARQKQLVVGTSAIEVGIDFAINYLIFEALDVGSWIQRLGRLGRHKGEEQEGKSITFTNFVAHSLLPKYVVERIKNTNLLTSQIDKVSLINRIRNNEKEKRIFSPVNDFQNYHQAWGWLHPAHVINMLGHPRLRDNYAPLREQLMETYNDVFKKVNIAKMVKVYYKIKQNKPEVVETAVTRFRGETPFTCGILDEDDGEIKPYDLLWVLRNAETEWISKHEFMEVVIGKKKQPHQYKYVDVYLRLRSYRPEPERLLLRYNKAILNDFNEDDYRYIKVLSGFQIEGDFQDLAKINQKLKRKKLLCLIRREHANELKSILRLPPLFSTFPLIDAEGQPLSVTFSKDALLLHSLPRIRQRRN